MGAFFTAILAKVTGFAAWVIKLIQAVILACWDFVRDMLTWPFEQILDIAKKAIDSINVSGVSGSVGVWGQLPGEVLNILGVLGVGTAIGIISSAIAIRLVLQLIPFVRLGN